jgi:hypothetical protein
MSPRIHVLFLGKAHLPDISEDDALAVYIDEYPPQLVDTSDVGATLDSIRAQFTDATFTCSPDLATLAEPHGFVVEPWPSADARGTRRARAQGHVCAAAR